MFAALSGLIATLSFPISAQILLPLLLLNLPEVSQKVGEVGLARDVPIQPVSQAQSDMQRVQLRTACHARRTRKALARIIEHLKMIRQRAIWNWPDNLRLEKELTLAAAQEQGRPSS